MHLTNSSLTNGLPVQSTLQSGVFEVPSSTGSQAESSAVYELTAEHRLLLMQVLQCIMPHPCCMTNMSLGRNMHLHFGKRLLTLHTPSQKQLRDGSS